MALSLGLPGFFSPPKKNKWSEMGPLRAPKTGDFSGPKSLYNS